MKDEFFRALGLVLFFAQVLLSASVWLTVYFIPATDCLTEIGLTFYVTNIISSAVTPGVVVKVGQPALGILLFFLAVGNVYLLLDYGGATAAMMCR